MTRPSLLTRRDCLALLAAGGILPWMPASAATDSTLHLMDWDWLRGDWNVLHSRLKDRLVHSKVWQKFAGKSSFWTAMGGVGNFDDNLLELPSGPYRGLSVRAFNPWTSSWAIWWLDGRNPERIDPPVRGGFKGDEGEFIGTDVYQGTRVTVRFRWHEVRGSRPWWDQAFSVDGGKTWEINWRNYFTRTHGTASGQSRIENDSPEARAWDFLRGHWKVRNRRLRARFVQAGANEKDWEEFDSTLTNRQVLGGRGNVGDNWFDVPGGPFGGISLRAWNDEKKEWLSWWVDSRSPANIGPPMRGRFSGDSVSLVGDDQLDGKPLKVRSVWTGTETGAPRWEQSASPDGGKTWETNWVAELRRA